MKTFKQLMQDFDTVFSKYNPGAYENLAPPLPEEDVEKDMRELNIKDENVKALYLWKNGVKNEGGCLMMDGGELQDFDSIKLSVTTNSFHDPSLISIITDNGEESILFNTKPGKHYGKLYFYSVHQLYIDYPISCYDSLYTMIQTTIQAYKDYAYHYDKKANWLDIDFDKLTPIARKYNPNSFFWKDHDQLNPKAWYAV